MANDQTKAAPAVRSKDMPSLPEWDDISDLKDASAELTTLQRFIWENTPSGAVAEADFRQELQEILDDATAPLIAERDALAAKLAEVPQWISAEDRLPPLKTLVLVCFEDTEGVSLDMRVVYKGAEKWMDEDFAHDPPSHWMSVSSVPGVPK